MSQESLCRQCGKPMVQKRGSKGAFWSCSGYPECKFCLDDVNGAPLTACCPECGEPLRAGVNAHGPYTACFKKEKHADGQARFFGPDGQPREPKTALQANGDFVCPECGMPLKYFVQKKGKDAGKPCFACFEAAAHADGKARFYRDKNGAPEL